MIPHIHQTQLKNGVRLLAIESSDADIVAAHLFWQGGASAVDQNRQGLAHLMASVLTKGTETYSSNHVAEVVESMGALLGAECAVDYCGLALKSVSSDFPQLLKLASDIVRNPSFPVDEIERERLQTLQAIRAQQERPFTVAFSPLRSALFGSHPYAHSIAGTAESVAGFTQADLQDYCRATIRPDTTVIAVCGRIDRETIENLVRDCFGDWESPCDEDRGTDTPLPDMPTLNGACRLDNWQETQQTMAIVGYRVPSVYSADWTALKLLAVHLGGGLSSRLFVQLREKQGLAYDVSASYSSRRFEAPFIAHIGTAPENTERAIDGLKAEIERLLEQPLTGDELQLAKRKILGQYSLSKQTNAQLAQLMGWYEMVGLGIDRDSLYPDMIEALSSQDLLDVAQRNLCHPVVSVAGPGTC